nr:Chain B, TIF2 peptide [synthetic construct]
AQALAALLAKA